MNILKILCTEMYEVVFGKCFFLGKWESRTQCAFRINMSEVFPILSKNRCSVYLSFASEVAHSGAWVSDSAGE